MSKIARDLFQDKYRLISQYVDILTSRGNVWGVLGPREADRIWERHILNSVSIADLIPSGASVSDIGSGAGLPGLPVAILRPDLHVTCVEPLLRRVTFLTEAVAELGLADRVDIIRGRAEDLTVRFDAVMSRALAPLAKLAGWCSPLMAESGQILAIKGQSAFDELTRDSKELSRLGLNAEAITCRAHPCAEPTYAVRMTRARAH